jgi:hypothetical protein
VIWRAFRKSPARPHLDAWWRDAEAAAEALRFDQVDALADRRARPDEDPDEAERQDEMIDGLRQLGAMAVADPLPVVVSQHRVIGADHCHFATPVSLGGDVASPGKLFVTADRLVFAGGRVHTWPWHRVQDVLRTGRHLVVAMTGSADGVQLQCNTYGDALVIRYLAARLRRRPAAR